MMRANHANVAWDADKKRWQIRIQIGAEVVKRPAPDTQHDAGDEALRAAAVQTARDEGYELDPAAVLITR
jgi:hypothetical protein